MTKRYEIYKDSGVQWLGEIPEHWICTSLGRILSEKLQYGASESGDLECTNDSMRYIRITDITIDGKLKPDVCKFLSSEIGMNYPVRKGDVLLARSGATVGKAFIYNEDDDACYAGYLIKASVQQEKVLPQFFFYFTQTSQYDEWKNRIFIQATIQNISAEKYARMSLCLPPLSEQHSIVTYLDDKCSKIDKSIENMEKQIVLLQEMKQRVIADAVTRGVDKTVKMKKSGIAWLDEVPEHWSVDKVSSHFRQRNEKVSDKDYPALSVSKKGITPQLENVALSNAEGSARKLVKVGDYAVNSRSDRKGSCGISRYEGSVSLITIVLEPFNIDGDYVHYLFRSNPWVEEFYRNGKGIVADLWTTNYQMMKGMYLPVPPIEEQQAIVSYINERTTKIETLAKKIEQEIVYLKEYKQRLISDVVTGQVKVC